MAPSPPVTDSNEKPYLLHSSIRWLVNENNQDATDLTQRHKQSVPGVNRVFVAFFFFLKAGFYLTYLFNMGSRRKRANCSFKCHPVQCLS